VIFRESRTNVSYLFTGAANLAGVLGPGKQQGVSDNSLLETSDEEWNRVIDINLTGLKNCLRSELRYRNQQGCSIINGASVSGQLGNPYNAAYGASKGGVIALTLSVALEMGHLGVRINAIAP
jgi:NAD(P)-dependent dehydrogenase (short-subunit alcohol dehydrogenase family)